MTRKLRQFILHSTLVFSVVASASAQVLTTYTNGDVFLGFRKPGAANTLAVNLGSATKFLIPAYGGTATPGVAFKVPFGVKPGTGSAVNNLSADLTTVFGPTWANSSADFDSVRWAVVGISGNTSSGIPGYAARTLFVTRARVAPSQPSLISPDRLEIGDFGEFSSAFNAFVQGTGGTAFKFQQSTTNSSVAYIGAASGPDNWGTRIDTASEGSFGLGSGAEVEQTFGDFSGPTDSVLDLWISPNTGSTTITVDRNTYLGSFTLNTAGELTFTPASPAIKPVVTSATRSATRGAPFEFQIAADNSPTSYNATGLPAGLAVNPTTGLVSGTPTVTGIFNVVISATNSAGEGTGTLALTVNEFPPVVGNATRLATVGTPFSFTITGNNSPTSYGATGLPAGLSVNTITGVISGTPTAAGSFSVTISASNSAGTGTGTLTLTVVSPNPVITSPTTATGRVGQAFSFQIAASNNPTSYGATGLPAGLSINTTTGLVSGVPTQTGIFSVTITATNGGGTGAATLVLEIPAPPVITSAGTSSGQLGSSFTFQVTASNNPTVYAINGLLPAGVSIDTATGVISGTPSQAGTFTVTVSATNAGGTGSGTLILNIMPRPLPVVVSSVQSGRVGLNIAFVIEASNAPQSYSARGLPAGLTINARTGQISGIPTQAGTFSVAISATNSTGTGNGTLTLSIAPRPVPVVISETISGRVAQTFWYQIKASEAPQSYAALNLPAGLTLNRTTGVITGTPTQAGTFTVAVSATNSTGTGNGTLALNIAQQPAPVVTSASQAGRVGLSFSYSVVATNNPRSFAAQGLPTGLSINTATGQISGIPTRAGTFTVSVSASNSGGTGAGTLTITISAPPSPPVVNPPSAPLTARLSQVFSYQVVASNSPTSYRAGSGAWPVWLRLNATTGQVSGTPNVRGNFTFTVIASNAGGSSAPVTIRINVQ